ncbi:MAG: outer membrane protein [Methylovirgula sp.]
MLRRCGPPGNDATAFWELSSACRLRGEHVLRQCSAYATGGGAFGHVKDYEWETGEGSESLGHTWTGWTAGVGLKAEYLMSTSASRILRAAVAGSGGRQVLSL